MSDDTPTSSSPRNTIPLLLPYPAEAPVLAGLIGAGFGEAASLETRHFPDGETYLRLFAQVAGRDVCVVCDFNRPDAKVPGLLYLADLLREYGARRLILISPYLPYMRQDVRFNEGEAITSRSFARLISGYFDALLTVDPHLHRYDSLDEIYSIPALVVRAAPAISEWIKDSVTTPVLIGPDAESAQWVQDVADRANAPCLILHKVRHGDREVEISIPDLKRWRHHTPVLIDDIISTGETLATTVRQLCESGLSAPVCVGVHAVFSGTAEDDLRAAGAGEIVSCNTLRHRTNRIDIAPALGQALPGLLADLTVGD